MSGDYFLAGGAGSSGGFLHTNFHVFDGGVSGEIRMRNGANTADANVTVNNLATSDDAPTMASSATIAPTARITCISGTITISTITAPAMIPTGGGTIVLIPTGAWAADTAGNIALATTAVVNKAVHLTYDDGTNKWYPSC